MGEIHLNYVSIYYDDPIICLIFKENVELGFPEIRELTKVCEKISDYKPYLVLSDVRNNVDVTQEGRRMASDINVAPLHRGTAVLVKNGMYQLAANFFINFNKPQFPFHAFTDKQEAIDWLMNLTLDTSSQTA